jgi:hypothetical protein
MLLGGICGWASLSVVSDCYWKIESNQIRLNTSLEDVNKRGLGLGTDTTISLTSTQMKQQSSFVGFDFDNIWGWLNDGSYEYPILRAFNRTSGNDTDDTIPEDAIDNAIGNGITIKLANGEPSVISMESLQKIKDGSVPVKFELENGLLVTIDPAKITDNARPIDLNIIITSQGNQYPGVPANNVIIEPSAHGDFGFELGITIPKQIIDSGLGSNADNIQFNYVDESGKVTPIARNKRNGDGSLTVWINSASYYYLTVATSVPIGTAAELNTLLRADLSGEFHLTADINLSGIDWQPIGDSSSPFDGTLDGRGYKISNLTINRPIENNQGLFGVLGVNGTVKNLGLVNCNIRGNNRVGGIVGTNDGSTIENCYSTGVIIGVGDRVGGIAGENSGTIQNSYSTANITGFRNVGGIAGMNGEVPGFAIIKNCYSTGDVIGAFSVGGIAGMNFKNINDCVALIPTIIGNIGSGNRINGGKITGFDMMGSVLTNNHARSDMVAYDYRYYNDFGMYADANFSGGIVDGSSITTTQYNSQSWWQSTVSFNFNDIWDWCDTQNLPILRVFNNTGGSNNSSVNIIVTAPVASSTRNTTATGTGDFTASAVTWSPNDTTFKAGTRYTATVTLTATNGNDFTGLTEATINGETARIGRNSGTTLILSYTFPATAQAMVLPPTEITSTAITVTAPVTGESRNTTASGIGNFTTSAVTWSPSDSPFKAGLRYTATVTLTANNESVFSETATATINGQSTTVVRRTATSMIISYTFLATERPALQNTVISTADITVTAPVTGATPNRTATGGAGYTCSAITWAPADGTFKAGTRYTATITLTASSGHTFGSSPTITVNGDTARIVRATETSVILSYMFDRT